MSKRSEADVRNQKLTRYSRALKLAMTIKARNDCISARYLKDKISTHVCNLEDIVTLS
jgi:hypothetical protein